jgi:hypothetical protein
MIEIVQRGVSLFGTVSVSTNLIVRLSIYYCDLLQVHIFAGCYTYIAYAAVCGGWTQNINRYDSHTTNVRPARPAVHDSFSDLATPACLWAAPI